MPLCNSQVFLFKPHANVNNFIINSFTIYNSLSHKDNVLAPWSMAILSKNLSKLVWKLFTKHHILLVVLKITQISCKQGYLPVGLEVLEDLAIQEGLEFPDNILRRPGQFVELSRVQQASIKFELSRVRQASIMVRPHQFTELRWAKQWSFSSSFSSVFDWSFWLSTEGIQGLGAPIVQHYFSNWGSRKCNFPHSEGKLVCYNRDIKLAPGLLHE